MACLLAVHEATWNDIWGEQLITLSEFLEDDAVGEALPADTDSLKHTIATQLVQHQRSTNFACL